MEDKHIPDIILNALEQSTKAQPSEALLLKMENIALAYSAKVASFSRQAALGIAASFLILMVVNIYTVNKYYVKGTETNLTDTADIYNLVPTKSIYK
jgi:hypothetical protein